MGVQHSLPNFFSDASTKENVLMNELLMFKSGQKNLFLEIGTLTENTQPASPFILSTETSPPECPSFFQLW